MKRLALAVAALCVAAGCASTDAGSPATVTVTPDTSTSQAASVAPVDSKRAALESVLEDEGIWVPDGFAPEYARIVCQGLDDGLSPIAVIAIGVDAIPEYSPREHAYMVGASVGAYCPRHNSLFGVAA